MALIVGHTLNWFVNGNFSTIIIHRLFLKRSIKKDLFKFTDYLERRVQGKAFILYVAVFGSMSRGELKGSSDLDVSIVRKPGLANALPALREVFIIKKMADLKGVPLEIFLSDTPENSVDRFKGETVPVVIYDPDGSLEKYYTKTMSLEEAYKLNHP
jgi:predicted nucleotidyltransferase